LEAAEQVDRQLLKELLSQTASWKSHRLSEVAEVRLGRQRSPDKVRGIRPVKYLRAANVREGYIDFDDVMEMDFTEDEQLTYQLQADDLLLVEGGEARDVGMCAMFTRQEQPVCFQNTVLRVRILDQLTLMPDFLFQMFKQLKRDGVFSALSGGTKLKHLGSGNVNALKISLPPQVEQERHVFRLTASGTAVTAAQRHLEDINALRSSLVNSILTPATSTPALVTA
jgi:type I restriction enzyme, S subunit